MIYYMLCMNVREREREGGVEGDIGGKGKRE